jgi:hypothetical protein
MSSEHSWDLVAANNKTNEDLWERTGQSKTDEEIMRRKYGWIGHTLRKYEKVKTKFATAH